MKKITVMILAVMAVMPSVSTAHMSDISGEVSTETMLPLGDIKNDWSIFTEKDLMELLKTKDKQRILLIMKKLCLDGFSDSEITDIMVIAERMTKGKYPAIYIFYRGGLLAQGFKKQGFLPSNLVAQSLQVMMQDMMNSNPNPTETEFKLMEKEAWDYINSL